MANKLIIYQKIYFLNSLYKLFFTLSLPETKTLLDLCLI